MYDTNTTSVIANVWSGCTADIFNCHSRKHTGGLNNTNDPTVQDVPLKVACGNINTPVSFLLQHVRVSAVQPVYASI